MTRRRLLEIGVALAILVLLIAVFLVRPTAKRTEAPPAALFHPVAGAIPDLFTDDGIGRITARSPDGAQTAVLYPVEFEEPADLYVLTAAGQGVRFVLNDSISTTLTPKNVGWIDATTLWVTLGERYGTVSPGGDLHVVDAATGEGRILWVSPDSGRTQVVGAAPEPDGRWILVRLKAFDQNMATARDSTIRLPASAPPRGGATTAR